MRSERRKRADGTDIDSVKSLAEYVQSFPQSGESDVPAPSAPVASAPPAIAPVVPDPELEKVRAESQRHKDEAARLSGELAAARTRAEAEATTRRILAEQQAPKPVPVVPQEDPRLDEVDNLWFTEPKRARALMQEIQRDETRKQLDQQRGEVKKEVFTELSSAQRKEQATLAYAGAMTKLQERGVKPDQITRNRINSLYATITRPPAPNAPNPYYDAGGPLSERVLLEAWGELFGIPEGGTAGTSAGVVAPAQVVTPTPVPVAPPGSSRPAPAATPRNQNERLPALSAEQKRDIEHMANTFGYDPEKMAERRRKRLASERQ